MPQPIEQILNNLDRWRHLPCYQLERRFDVFLTPYLKSLLEEHLNRSLAPLIIPEMPLKQITSKRSDKVDFVLFSEDFKIVYFVELKTACRSDRKTQIEYLNRATKAGWRQILLDLREILSKSRYRHKYLQLLELLEQANQVTVDNALRDSVAANPRRGPYKKGWITVLGDATIQVVYIRPIPATDGRDVICFDDVIEHLDSRKDGLSELLIQCLKRWKTEPGIFSEDKGAECIS